jgi:hypothetical protein
LAVSRAFGLPCEEPKVKVDQKDTEGMSALMYAAEMGHMQVPWIPLAKTGRFADRIIYLFFCIFFDFVKSPDNKMPS